MGAEHRPFKDHSLFDLLLMKTIFETMQTGKVDETILPLVDKIDEQDKPGLGTVHITNKVNQGVNSLLRTAVTEASHVVDAAKLTWSELSGKPADLKSTANFVDKILEKPVTILPKDKINIGEIWTNENVKKAVAFIFKVTAFKVFFGGVGRDACVRKCVKLADKGIGAIVDFAGKEKHDNPTDADFDKALEKYKESVDICNEVKSKTKNSEAEVAAAFKFTTVAPMEDLMEISKCITENRELEGTTLEKYNKIKERAEKFFQYAKEKGVEAYADAEHTTINPAINKICTELHEADLKPTFTIQAYLKDSKKLAEQLLAMNPPPNIKLVRGAYIGADHQPRDDIFENKEGTDKNYNELLEMLYNSGKIEKITVATHNAGSREIAANLIKNKKEGNETKIIFSTLLGIGAELEQAEGIAETKYVPVALIDKNSTWLEKAEAVLGCIAYFGRRAKEFMGPLNDGTDRTRSQAELSPVRTELDKRYNYLFGELGEDVAKRVIESTVQWASNYSMNFMKNLTNSLVAPAQSMAR